MSVIEREPLDAVDEARPTNSLSVFCGAFEPAVRPWNPQVAHNIGVSRLPCPGSHNESTNPAAGGETPLQSCGVTGLMLLDRWEMRGHLQTLAGPVLDPSDHGHDLPLLYTITNLLDWPTRRCCLFGIPHSFMLSEISWAFSFLQ